MQLDIDVVWNVTHPSEKIIFQVARLLYQEWNDSIERWLDDVYFYLIEKNWRLTYLEKENRLIGAMIYKHLPRSNSVALSYIILHKDFRGKGIGTFLLKRLENYAAHMGALSVFFDSSEPLGRVKKYFFIDKLGYSIAKVPVLLPDEPPLTYLFIKFLSAHKCIDSVYYKKLLMEYVEASYSEEELRRYRNIFNLMFSAINSLDRVCLTNTLFLKGYVNTTYAKKLCREFPIEKLEVFVNRVIGDITSQPCGIG